MGKKKKPDHPGVPFNFGIPEHQHYGVRLSLMYYSAGDFKDAYEDDFAEDFMETFELKTDEEMAQWLDHFGGLFMDSAFLQLNPHSAAQAMEPEDFYFYIPKQ